MHKWMVLLIFPAVLRSQTAVGERLYQIFEVYQDNGQVCRRSIEPVQPKICIAYIQEANLGFPSSLDLIGMAKLYLHLKRTGQAMRLDQLRALAGVLVLSDQRLQNLIDNFQALSVQNVGLDFENVRRLNDQIYLRFLGSVHWSSAKAVGAQGDLNIDGDFHIPFVAPGVHDIAYIPAVVKDLTPDPSRHQLIGQFLRLLSVHAISDSWPIASAPSLDLSERNARFEHFSKTGDAKTVEDEDLETLKLIQETIAPVVLSHAFLLPQMQWLRGR